MPQVENGISRSLKFTDKLITHMQQHFGNVAFEIAENITTKQIRTLWLKNISHDAVNMYIQNMQFLVNYLDTLKQQFGAQIALITSELVAAEELSRWQEIAMQTDDHRIENFITLCWEPLKQYGFEFTVDYHQNSAQIHCTACPIAQLANKIGGREWLTILECNKDLANHEGFNQQIKISRTKTLMKGDTHCDHLYQYKKD